MSHSNTKTVLDIIVIIMTIYILKGFYCPYSLSALQYQHLVPWDMPENTHVNVKSILFKVNVLSFSSWYLESDFGMPYTIIFWHLVWHNELETELWNQELHPCRAYIAYPPAL